MVWDGRERLDEAVWCVRHPAIPQRIGYLAEFERDLIRARAGEGRKRAIARGVKMGRPSKLTPHQKKEALRRVAAGEPIREVALSYNVHNSTISRLHEA